MRKVAVIPAVLLLAIAYVSVNQATYLMVTESPDRIRVTQR